MKGIKIAQRLRPYTIEPGVPTIIPSSWMSLILFPGQFSVINLCDGSLLGSWQITLPEVIFDFQMINDLESGRIHVRLKGSATFFEYYLTPSAPTSLELFLQRAQGAFILNGKEVPCKVKVPLLLGEVITPIKSTPMRISFGAHQKLDWRLVGRRMDLLQILPIWILMGLQIPALAGKCTGIGRQLLDQVIQAQKTHERTVLFRHIHALFVAAFDGLMHPQLQDHYHRGWQCDVGPGSPLLVLQESSQVLMECFVRWDGSHLALLPALPVECHCGRIIHMELSHQVKVEFEWSKKQIRRVHFFNQSEDSFSFSFSCMQMQQARLRKSVRDKGVCKKLDGLMVIPSGESHYLDHFA